MKVNLETTSAAIMMLVIMLPYGRDALEVPALTVFMMFLLGSISYLKNDEKRF